CQGVQLGSRCKLSTKPVVQTKEVLSRYGMKGRIAAWGKRLWILRLSLAYRVGCL
ncbi:hypothetical protein BgiBS90_028357, partial [Biomphalaria glabrata]